MTTAFKRVANRAAGTLNTTMDGSVTTLVLDSGQGALFPAFPGNDYIITVENERMVVTARTGDSLTVTRGQDGTSAVGHSAGVAVELNVIATLFDDLTVAVNALETSKLQRLEGWVADDAQNPSLGTIPADSYIVNAHLQVTELFDSDGTDNIQCGDDSDNGGIFADVDVATTGIKSVTLGAYAGYVAAPLSIEAYYTAGGSAPTTGKALVVVEYYTVTTEVV